MMNYNNKIEVSESLIKDLKELMTTCKDFHKEYEKSENEAENIKPIVQGIRRGKKEAYGYMSNKINNLLHWYGFLSTEEE